MGNLMTYALALLKKIKNADPATRSKLGSFIQECKDLGAIPLGIRDDASGKKAYWWLVSDLSRFPSEKARLDELRRRSPDGLTLVVLTI